MGFKKVPSFEKLIKVQANVFQFHDKGLLVLHAKTKIVGVKGFGSFPLMGKLINVLKFLVSKIR